MEEEVGRVQMGSRVGTVGMVVRATKGVSEVKGVTAAR